MWYPQGGGAELATSLYVRSMIQAGHKVTLATNQDARVDPETGQAGNVVRFPFGSSATKVEITLLSSCIERIAEKLAAQHDVACIPGKLLFAIPLLKKANPSPRVVVHLHDYQLLCPHALLLSRSWNPGLTNHTVLLNPDGQFLGVHPPSLSDVDVEVLHQLPNCEGALCEPPGADPVRPQMFYESSDELLVSIGQHSGFVQSLERVPGRTGIVVDAVVNFFPFINTPKLGCSAL